MEQLRKGRRAWIYCCPVPISHCRFVSFMEKAAIMEKEVLMADTSVSFKCPNCSAPLAYAPGADHVTCEYCGTELSIADLEAFYAAKEENAAKAEEARQKKWDTDGAGKEWSEDEAKILRAFTCSSCGAEIVCDENTIATECCYCGNPTMIAQRYDGALRPDYVIPFQKTKKDAQEAFKNFYKGKLLLPSNFVSQNRVDAIQGMYVPFWLFDSKVTATASYKAKNVNTFVVGKNQITEERVYRCDREGEMKFNRVPMDGSKKWTIHGWKVSDLSIIPPWFLLPRHTWQGTWPISMMCRRKKWRPAPMSW